MKKEYKIAVHPIQMKIIQLIDGKVFYQDSLRGIAEKIGTKKTSPQQIKHHLTQLIRYGFLDVVEGKYRIGKIMKDL